MIIVGVDESGTGAWAGPFTVCALAVRNEDQEELKAMGVRDSKVLTDAKRRSLVDWIADIAIIGHCSVVPVEEIRDVGQRQAWRNAVRHSVLHITSRTKVDQVLMDGLADEHLVAMMRAAGIKMSFMPRADKRMPVVGAASIIAKTVRNDRMLELHRELPMYGWKDNTGYGTQKHIAAIKKHGISKYHRPIKTLNELDNTSGSV